MRARDDVERSEDVTGTKTRPGRGRLAMRAAAMVAMMAVLAGCAAQVEPPSADAPASPEGPGGGPRADTADSGLVAQRPTHPVGRAWTYEGDELYNQDASFTVVVARADTSGYLFAGGAEDDLVYPALWGSPWIGERDLDGDRESDDRLSFPLEDGKSWPASERVTVTARVATIQTPLGSEQGFVIEGAGERVRVSYDYSPSLGVITRYEDGPLEGEPWDTIRLTGVADNVSWVWFELGELVRVGNPHEPQSFEIAEGFDAVIASAGGRDGSRAIVAPPGGAQAWSQEFGPEEDWRHAILDPATGRWSAEIVGRPYVEGVPEIPAEPPVGWAYMHLAPVKWVRGAP